MSALSEARRRVKYLIDEFEITSAVQIRLTNADLLELAEAAGARCPVKVQLLANSLKAGAKPTHCVVPVTAVQQLIDACDYELESKPPEDRDDKVLPPGWEIAQEPADKEPEEKTEDEPTE